MRYLNLAVAIVSLSVSAAVAQQGRTDAASINHPRYDVEAGYNYVSANAPPGGCSSCFGLNGGFVSGGVHLNNLFSLASTFTGNHASNISLLGQDLTLMTFLAGPRISHTFHRRFNPYADVLFGGARASDSYFPLREGGSTTSAASWAYSAGGGVDIDLTRRIGIRAVDVQYLRTNFFNGLGSRQNQLQVGAGIQFKFGNRTAAPSTVAMRAPQEIAFTCSANSSSVVAGDTVEFVGNAMTQPDQIPVDYTWSTSAGKLDGSGRRVTLITAGMAPGKYVVTGHATLTSNAAVSADCATGFRVTYGPPQLACLASESHVVSGQPVTITIQEGPNAAPSTTYSYRASAGTVAPNGKTARLDTTGVATGDITVRCRGVDSENQVSEASVNINVTGPSSDVGRLRKSTPTQLCSVLFKRYAKNPTRLDNEGKACLDQVAISLKHAPEARLLIVGSSSRDEAASNGLAQSRARKAKNYLTSEQGIDPNRIQMRVSSDGIAKQVDNYLIQDGDPNSAAEDAPEIKRSSIQ